MEKCFAMRKKGCAILVKNSSCEGCAFCKTRKEKRESLKAAYARLRALPVHEQEYYAEKYYGGKMPWAR